MLKRLSFLYMGLVALLSTGGVFAAWQYANGAPPTSESISIILREFEFAPEQILPGGDVVEKEEGGDHLKLIERILNEKEKNYGLNMNDNGLLHKYLKDAGVVFCNQQTSGGNLKFILDTKAYNTYGLYYCLEKKSDTEYYCYTFGVDDLSAVGGTTSELEVYLTKLVKTDKWKATTSHRGYAKTKKLEDMGVKYTSDPFDYSIDMSTWRSA